LERKNLPTNVSLSTWFKTNVTSQNTVTSHRRFISKTVNDVFDADAFFNVTYHEIEALSILIREFFDALIPLLERCENGIQIHINTSNKFAQFLDLAF
jgi:hypothetical protein